MEVRRKLLDRLFEIAPHGMRLMSERGRPFASEIAGARLCCAGSQATMGYYCCLEPGHKGKCYSAAKQVDFTPDGAPSGGNQWVKVSVTGRSKGESAPYMEDVIEYMRKRDPQTLPSPQDAASEEWVIALHTARPIRRGKRGYSYSLLLSPAALRDLHDYLSVKGHVFITQDDPDTRADGRQLLRDAARLLETMRENGIEPARPALKD